MNHVPTNILNMNLIKKYRQDLMLFLILIVAGQLLFLFLSTGFTSPHYEGSIYATTGAKHKQEDLHTLNDAAHYFGQTIIGWLKFPHFFSDIQKVTHLSEGSALSAHLQERQNIIFTVTSPSPVEISTLKLVKDYIQGKMDIYNNISDTNFALTNIDYEQVIIKKSYIFGALVTLIASAVIALAVVFVKKELL